MSKRMAGTVLFTSVFYFVFIFSVFAESAFWVRAFGATHFGLPTPFIASVIITLFFLPVPWFAWHGVDVLMNNPNLSGETFQLRPELRRSLTIAALGCAYFLVLMVGWIVYADSHGL